MEGEFDMNRRRALMGMNEGDSMQKWTTDGILSGLEPSGELYTELSLWRFSLAYNTKITKIVAPNYNNTYSASESASLFAAMTSLEYAIMPKNNRIGNAMFNGDSKLKGLDFLGAWGIGSTAFTNCAALKTIVIRGGSVASLNNTNALNGTPFASGKAGGKIYVPQSITSNYQANSNWATILSNNSNNQILAIEGSTYETHYVDGSDIPSGG